MTAQSAQNDEQSARTSDSAWEREANLGLFLSLGCLRLSLSDRLCLSLSDRLCLSLSDRLCLSLSDRFCFLRSSSPAMKMNFRS